MTLRMRPSGLVLEEKRILAWHDTTAAYAVAALFCLIVMVFSTIGFLAAGDIPEYNKYAWVPEILLVLSAFLFFFSVARLIRRLIAKAQGENGLMR